MDSKERVRLLTKEYSRILIIPFPKDMWGGQHHFESKIRILTTILIANDFHKYGKRVSILCEGGLANHEGLTLAQDAQNNLLEANINDNKVFTSEELILGEQKSTHTGQQVRLSLSDIEEIEEIEGQFDLIIAVSNKWHLMTIVRLYKNFGLHVIGLHSPTGGSMLYRLSQMVQGIIRIIMTATIDQEGTFFDKYIKERNLNASKK